MAAIAQWAAQGAHGYDVNDQDGGLNPNAIEHTDVVTGANGERTYVTTTSYADGLRAVEAAPVDYASLKKLTRAQKGELLAQVMEHGPQNNEVLMRKVYDRLEKVGLSFPGVEVRFTNLTAEMQVPAGGSHISTLATATESILKLAVSPLMPKPPTKRQVLLDGVSGVLKPGRMTVLLGPPGAGKTTLLRSLAGQMRDNKAVQFTGGLTYNGLVPGDDFVVARTAAYVDQVDSHTAEMTVAETLYFASECLGPGLSEELYHVMTEREKAAGITPDPELEQVWVATFARKDKSILVEMFARLLGIDHVMDTYVGDELLKGISGGQKRRVTSAELTVGLAQVMMLDEISTGLDSASTYLIVRALRNLCVYMNGTYLISLLQPSPEVFELFDDVMLMAGRRIVYHGPVSEVLPYFASLGLECPPSKTTADFLQEVVTLSDQGFFWTKPEPWSYISPKKLSAHFLETPLGQETLTTLDAPPFKHEFQHRVLHHHRYALSALASFKAVLRREVLLLFRNWLMLGFGAGQTAFVAFIVSTTFPRLPKDDFAQANLYLSVCFFSLMCMFMGGFNFAPIFTKRLPVFFKQRNYHFYPAWSYALAGSLLRVPEHFLSASLWTVMVYFSVGFVVDAGRFFIFWLNMFSCAMFSTSLFQLLGALTRNDVLAQGLGAVALLMSIVTSGFPIARTSIGGWWIWMYWISPMSWNLRSLVINELMSKDWRKSSAEFGGPPDMGLGEFALRYRGFNTEWKWVWIGIGVEFGISLLFIALQALALTYLGPRISTACQSCEVDDSPIHLRKQPSKLKGNAVAPCQNCQTPQQQQQGTASRPGSPATPAGPRGSPRPAFPSNGGSAQADGVAAKVTNLNPATSVSAVTMDMAEQGGAGSAGGVALTFTPVTFAFQEISYFVPKPKASGEELQLLRGVSGSFRPGVLTALMGASGAGKTTLMDVLAGRKTAGRMEGQQLVNGHPKRQSVFARVMGYVEQLDVHVPQATVREALAFSARIRLPAEVSDDKVSAFVDEVMNLVELAPLAGALVGSPASGGLSTEARKRLTIAVELVANPSIIFMDEPTSGLDARAAALVMRATRNIVSTGRTVVCTIHQPSTAIFEAFDDLLLLKPGGRTIYCGPLGTGAGAPTLVAYFAGVAKVTPFPEGGNPANWMLEVSNQGVEREQGVDFADLWDASPNAQAALERVAHDAAATPGVDGVPLAFTSRYAASYGMQLRMLLKRGLVNYWRSPNYNVLRAIVTIVIGIVFGTLFLNRGEKRDTMLGLLDILGAIYSTTVFMGIANCLIVLPVVHNERAVFYRERSSGMYNTVVYTMAQGFAELPYLLTQSVAYTLMVYWLVGFEADAAKFFWFLLFFILNILAFTFFGVAVMHLMPAVPLATSGAAFFLLLWNLFCGFMLYRDDIYGWWIWAYYFNPATYVLYGTITTQLGDLHDVILKDVPGGISVAAYLEDTYSYKYSFRGWLVLIMAGFVIFFRMVACVGLSKINFAKR